MSTEVAALVKRLEKDKKVLKLKEKFDTLDGFRLPVSALKDEIENLHITRPVRTLRTNGGDFVKNIIEASMADQATRSRLSEISIQAYRAEKFLTNTLEMLRDHLIVEHSARLSMFKTKEERLRIVNLTLTSFEKYARDVNMIQNMAATIIKDIDQASYSLKLISETLKLHNRPESSI